MLLACEIIILYICFFMNAIQVRSILSLCILLLGGYFQSHAHPERVAFRDAAFERSEHSTPASFERAPDALPLVSSFAASRSTTWSFKIVATEITEEEERYLTSSRRIWEYSNDFASVFCALTRGYFLSCIREILPFHYHSSTTLFFRRHLLLNVFRI